MIVTWPPDLTNECWKPFQDAIFIIDALPIKELNGHYNLTPSNYEQIHALLAGQQNL